METNKRALWQRVYPAVVYDKMTQLRYGETKQKNKAFMTAVKTGLLVLMSPLLFTRGEEWYYGLLILLMALVLYQTDIMMINKDWDDFNQRRHYEFLYFFQLVVPYLKQAGTSKLGLFNVLNRMEPRLSPADDKRDGILKHGVNTLLIEMTNRPNDINVFKEFAHQCSGTDIAEDIAVSLFDWQQNSTNTEQLDRLGAKINRALEARIDEMVEKKLDRFGFYSQRVLFATIIMSMGILGITIATQIIQIFQSIA